MKELIELGLTILGPLVANINAWIARGRASGELTAEQEAFYQNQQKEIYSQPYAQPGEPLKKV